jgi:prophage tail gpP-like protein
MSELKESILYVKFDGDKTGTDDNGKQRKFKGTTNIEDWSIDSAYLGSTDGFSFTIIDDNPNNLRDLECQPVSLYVNGACQLIGRIDQTVRGDKGKSVVCRGRDYMADLVECNIDPTFVVKEGEKLGDMIVRAASPVGIKKVADGSDVSTARNVRTGRAFGDTGPPPNFKGIKQEDMKPDPGQGIYEFLKKICERHGCTIQPDISRDSLLVTSPLYKQDVPYKITRLRNSTEANNVDSAVATRDYSSFPSLVIVQGHGSPKHGEKTKSDQGVIDTWSVAQQFVRDGEEGSTSQGELGRTLNIVTWSGRRKPGEDTGDLLAQNKIYRLNHFRDTQARTKLQLDKAATRLLNEHLKNTLVYEVTLIGHVDPFTGAVWSTDTIVDVNDDICDVHEKLWVMDRSFSFSSGGAKTRLKCIRPGSYEI